MMVWHSRAVALGNLMALSMQQVCRLDHPALHMCFMFSTNQVHWNGCDTDVPDQVCPEHAYMQALAKATCAVQAQEQCMSLLQYQHCDAVKTYN